MSEELEIRELLSIEWSDFRGDSESSEVREEVGSVGFLLGRWGFCNRSSQIPARATNRGGAQANVRRA